ncbi:DNA-binding response regulator, OmpR family, contains REC and winged-helix (wHTH) domain [Pseudobutyrivibrio sp. NOR37]|uniref:Stage 0 sporulation protein A homolog n=1 Tax=Pseudobutyrivibrio xylanivorans TaxID=185007 RepID=A0A6M0LLC1_PSEXY|nr:MULTISPECIES: response regulator transcription factor [Pseudobutyrivibrio]NEX02759.1 response regulator transcription factor [Pseudobutyrivibrio xylanivorans]SFR80883.1 DNA-binding response regulator, OmpR family, contains REC and winged-helix (wHTH) domain [Pseudobutyrivibrio sp. NOR37]
MKKILVVDDEEKIRSIIRKYGEFEGYLIEEATDGMDAIQKVRENSNYDVIIMDVMMPELDGFSACTEIKKIKDIPVIMLSARGEEYDRIHGFEAGVDDYVVKPFSPKELMMRVKVVTSRVRTTEGQADIFEYEGLEINFTARTVSIDGKRIEMSPKEYELLFYLAKNKNIALQRDQIITQVWGYDYYGDDRTLDTHIKLLRNSLGEYRKLLVTLRGIGYRFET